jgi:hypothetical protein
LLRPRSRETNPQAPPAATLRLSAAEPAEHAALASHHRQLQLLARSRLDLELHSGVIHDPRIDVEPLAPGAASLRGRDLLRKDRLCRPIRIAAPIERLQQQPPARHTAHGGTAFEQPLLLRADAQPAKLLPL